SGYLDIKIRLTSAEGFNNILIDFKATSLSPVLSYLLARYWREAFQESYIKLGDTNSTASYIILKENIKTALKDVLQKKAELKDLYKNSKFTSKKRKYEIKKDKLYSMESTLYELDIEYNRKAELLGNYIKIIEATTDEGKWLGNSPDETLENNHSNLSEEQIIIRKELIRITKKYRKSRTIFFNKNQEYNLTFTSNHLYILKEKIEELEGTILEINNDMPLLEGNLSELKKMLSRKKSGTNSNNITEEKRIELELKINSYKNNFNYYIEQKKKLTEDYNKIYAAYNEKKEMLNNYEKNFNLAGNEFELLKKYYAELQENILQLKIQQNATITEINYYRPAVGQMNKEITLLERDINEISYHEAAINIEISQKEQYYKQLNQIYEQNSNKSTKLFERIELLKKSVVTTSPSTYNRIIFTFISISLGLSAALFIIILAFLIQKTSGRL
ncbi:MAG: hypothetical protein KAS39_04400, partial [Actinomycetia bacterium]|nr:hypothetical protein [Actinomycetes bacterium]